ncbi:MAG: dihydroneopterin aldolase [Bacteroidota bacterium]
MTRTDLIRIKNAVFYAYHGAETHEQSLGGKFEIDVDLYCDLSGPKKSDHLTETVNYQRVYNFLKNLVLENQFFLLEALANTIGHGILKEFPKVERTVVRVRKPQAPVKGVVDFVEVEVSAQREG